MLDYSVVNREIINAIRNNTASQINKVEMTFQPDYTIQKQQDYFAILTFSQPEKEVDFCGNVNMNMSYLIYVIDKVRDNEQGQHVAYEELYDEASKLISFLEGYFPRNNNTEKTRVMAINNTMLNYSDEDRMNEVLAITFNVMVSYHG